MSIECRFNQPKAVYLEPTIDAIVSTAATVEIYTVDGSLDQALTVTLPAASATVLAGSTNLSLVVASASGFVVGSRLRVDTQGTTQTPKISRISGSTIYLASSLGVAPEVGDAVRALRITATIPAMGEGKLGCDYRLEWSYSDGSAQGYVSQLFNVVRWPFVNPIDAETVAAVLAEQFEDRRTDEFIDRVVERVHDKLNNKLAATGHRAHLFPDPSRFREPARTAIRLILAESGYIPTAATASEYIRALRFEFDDLCEESIRSIATPYDKDGDGALSDSERNQHWRTMRVRR
jgi:hypothetical protein